jgi:hypothetical protein
MINQRCVAFAVASSLLFGGFSSSAQTIGSVVLPRVPVGTPALIVPQASAPLSLSPLPASPLIAVPLLSPAPAAPVPALTSARSLTGALSAASTQGRDEAAALAVAFDGLKPESSDAVAVEAPARGPEPFARAARRLFLKLRRSEAALAAKTQVLPEGKVATDGELNDRLENLPTTNPERAQYMIDLFKLAGAKESDIALQDAGRGRNNIIVVKKGRTDRVIIVGGHYDKVSVGRGTIDNGTGSTLVANLYQVLHDVDTDATIVFVAFAREEEGLLGSQAYVRSLTPAQRSKVDAMVNLDTLAVDGTFSWKNNSTRALLDRLNQVSGKGHEVKEAYLNGGDADSSTFRYAGIPAVTIFGASQDVIFDKIHSENDSMGAFSLKHYKNAYLLVLAALKSLDRTPLGHLDPGSI